MKAHRLGLLFGLLVFAYWAHLLTPAFHVVIFDPAPEPVLVVCTVVLGYLFGWLGGLAWNALHRS